MKIIPIILSGGFGTRLWPLSRQKMPKQFLTEIFGEYTLFSKALKLVDNDQVFLPPMTVTNQEHKFFVLQEYKKLGIKADNIILEPSARNTAIAIICACLHAQKIYGETAQLLILSSDHLIEPKKSFEQSILNAVEVVDKNIVTFGIKPSFAATGYGYIKKLQKVSDNCFEIEKFVEKPDLARAKEFLEAGDYLWNGGIFLLQSDIFLSEAKKFLPDQLNIAENSIKNTKKDVDGCYAIDAATYDKAQNISVDYGILERSNKVAVTELISNWSDVGDFNSVHQTNHKDQNNNVIFGDVKTYDSSDSLVYADQGLVTCLGINNLVVVKTDDVLLIADKNRTQDIKKIVDDFKGDDRVKLHNRVFRPWGYYETISECSNFKVKRILVNPHSSLSLQMHDHRSEHWVVVKGNATVQNDEKIFDLKQGESTFIPLKTKHRLYNNGDQFLEIIEVQIGNYVGEDDIVRFEDIYGRR